MIFLYCITTNIYLQFKIVNHSMSCIEKKVLMIVLLSKQIDIKLRSIVVVCMYSLFSKESSYPSEHGILFRVIWVFL